MANNRYSQVKAKRVTKGLAAGATGGGGSITVSDTAPSGPSAGDLWFDSTVLRTYVYYNDGSSSQWVLSNPVGLKGPTGAAGSDGSSVSIYDTIDNLPLTGNTAGDQAYVTAVNRFYIFNGTGWYSISLVNTNPNITSVADASSNTTPFTLSTDGSASVITITATDPEDVPLTYTYSVTSGSLSNGGGTTATVVQGTGSNTNKFTVTPSTTEAYAGTFSLTFTASDGINTATSANSFTLNFITIVTNSKYTTLLATATGTSDNNNIADTSSNNHSITVTGDAYAGTV
jgi:VCBS repeat-containing protein